MILLLKKEVFELESKKYSYSLHFIQFFLVLDHLLGQFFPFGFKLHMQLSVLLLFPPHISVTATLDRFFSIHDLSQLIHSLKT